MALREGPLEAGREGARSRPDRPGPWRPARAPSAAPESRATTTSGARATTVKAANVPRLVVPPGVWSRMDVACAAPSASSRVACSQAAAPPGWERAIGTNHTATATAPAATVSRRSRQRRIDPATAMHASSANDSMIDGRKPARNPRTTTAATPWGLPGRARQASTSSAAQARRSKEWVATIDPLNHANGEVATTTPAARPTHRPPRSRPATTVSPAPAAEASAARSTSEWITPTPVVSWMRWPTAT